MEDRTKEYKKRPVDFKKEKELKAFLLEIEGAKEGRVYEIKTPFSLIGRKYGDILIEDEMVSKKHAQIDIIGDDIFYIKDLASTNGTYVNGNKISYYKLKEGDKIKIGNTILKFLKNLYDKNTSDK